MDPGLLEGKSQELAFIGSNNPALGRVNREFQVMLQVVADAGQHSLTRSALFTTMVKSSAHRKIDGPAVPVLYPADRA